jgi:hypothetical protein
LGGHYGEEGKDEEKIYQKEGERRPGAQKEEDSQVGG